MAATAAAILTTRHGRRVVASIARRTANGYQSQVFTGSKLHAVIRQACDWTIGICGAVLVDATDLTATIHELTGQPSHPIVGRYMHDLAVVTARKALHTYLYDQAVANAHTGFRFLAPPERTLDVFTDGSFNPQTQAGGWAAVTQDGQVMADAGRVDSATLSELNAILMAYDRTDFGIRSQLLVHTDCLPLVTAVKIWRKGLQDRVRRWLAVTDETQVAFGDQRLQMVWIRGHAGSQHNELADRLAGMARRQVNMKKDGNLEAS